MFVCVRLRVFVCVRACICMSVVCMVVDGGGTNLFKFALNLT